MTISLQEYNHGASHMAYCALVSLLLLQEQWSGTCNSCLHESVSALPSLCQLKATR